MARPRRCGLDWFPLDTILDDKMQFVEATHGIKGYAIVIKLLQKIYGHFGYFGEWNARTATLFANELRLPLKVVTDVVGTCVEEGIFHQEMFDKYGILTSAGIQRRYLAAARKRTDASIKSEYALAEPAQIYQSAVETPVSAPKTPISAVESTQKEIIRENNNNTTISTTPPSLTEIAKAIGDNNDIVELSMTEAFALAQHFEAYNQLNGWKYLDRWRDALRLFLIHERDKRDREDKCVPQSQRRSASKKTAATRTKAQSFDVEEFFEDMMRRTYGSSYKDGRTI